MINANELIPRLISEFGYPPNGAQMIAEKLINCTPQIQVAFTIFWEKGEFPNMEVEDYTFVGLVSEHGMKPIAALLTLDWLIREPEKAKESLKKGNDFVVKKNHN